MSNKKKKFPVYVVFGDSKACKDEFEFDTKKERDAFIMGVNACDGWMGATIYNEDEKTEWEAVKTTGA